MPTRKVLIVAHDYPPIRSTGAQRVMKFARYLPTFGYQPIVLTTARYGGLPSDRVRNIYRALDLVHGLFRRLRRGKEEGVDQEQAFRVATVESGSRLGRLRDNWMIPDTKMGWALPAILVGRRAIAELQPDIIFSSSPPETTHVIASWLSKLSGLPWVADLRDGWLFEPPNPEIRTDKTRMWVEQRMESNMIRRAAAVTTATEPLAEDLRQRYPEFESKAQCISNGYDPAEFAGLQRERGDDGTFLLVYTGALSASRKGTSPDAFFRALSQIVQREPLTALRVRVVGASSPREQAMARSFGLKDYVTFLPPVPNRIAHQHQLDADALLLITAPGQRSVATLKLFDYIGAGVPILALAEGNAAADIVSQYELGVTVRPDDASAIAFALEALMAQRHTAVTWPGVALAQQRFDRRELTSDLAELFDALLAR